MIKNGGKFKNIAIATAFLGIAYMLFRKVSGVSSLIKNVAVLPTISGLPSVKSGNLIVPVALIIENPTSGSITIEIKSAYATLADQAIATVILPTQAKTTIKANCRTTMYGYSISVPLTLLLQYFKDNLQEIISKKFDVIKEKLAITLAVTIANTVDVTISYKFSNSNDSETLGLSAASERKIKPFGDYVAYIPQKKELQYSDRIRIPNGTTEDTVYFMHEVVRNTLNDTKRLATWLKRESLKDTIQSIFDFVYNYIQYVPDSSFQEQVRRPLRTLWDRKGDCDCYSVLIASILTNMGIKYNFRIAAYFGRDYYQHVYVTIPTASGYYVCDPVMDKCFTEKEPTKFKDFPTH